MCCLAEIGMLVFGVITLVKGTFQFSRARIVRGAPAYAIGVILLLPLPVAFGIGAVIGAVVAARTGHAPTAQDLGPYGAIDVALVLLSLLASLVIALTTAQPADQQVLSLDMPPDGGPLNRTIDPNNPYAVPQNQPPQEFR
jgi:hypothetical protein